MTLKILIGADICPTETNFNLFAQADSSALVGQELSALLNAADYTIFNLETPLTGKLSPIAKAGPCLAAPVSAIHGLKAINPHFFTLANNHILDQGVQGLQSTEKVLKQAGIAYAGGGENLSEASKPYIATIKGIKLGIYCCAEHEFSIATETTPGANPYDPLVSFDAVRELKKQCDCVIVLYHGGKEYYRYPSPQLQRVFRKFADCGANMVVAQHTHCVGCMEEYKGAVLIYGQGNFLFDRGNDEYWNTNLLIELNIDENTKTLAINYIPCVKKGNGVRLADSAQSQQIVADFNMRSEQIQQEGFIAGNYQTFADKLGNYYLQKAANWLGRNCLVRVFNKLAGHRLFMKLCSKRDFLGLENILNCEAHREIFLQVVKGKIK